MSARDLFKLDGLLEQYFLDINNTADGLSSERENELSARIKEGDEEALNELVMANVKFVVTIAKIYQNYGVPVIDLINEGNLGLIVAAKKFEGDRGFRFISYAVWWIRQYIFRALSAQSKTVRLPLNLVKDKQRISKASVALEKDLGRFPTTTEIALKLGISQENLEYLSTVNVGNFSLDKTKEDGSGRSFMDFFAADEQGEPDKIFDQQEIKEKIKTVIEKALSEKEASIIKLYFGLDDGLPVNLDKIGNLHGLTRERVRQIKERALNKLRNPRWSSVLIELVEVLRGA